LLPRRRGRAGPRRQRAGARLRGPEAQDPGRRQARRPPRQQGRHRQDPPRRGWFARGGGEREGKPNGSWNSREELSPVPAGRKTATPVFDGAKENEIT